METINFSPKVYNHLSQYNHILFQMKLPLQIGILIDSSDPVWTFNEVMEGVNLSKYLKVNKLGREPYNPFMMLKVILFSEMLGGMSLRQLESSCKTDIRFMFLANEETPSHTAFANFINNRLSKNIRDIFLDVNAYIIEKDNVDTNVIYIDGTKMEANANKYTFVWKKTAIKTRDRKYAEVKDIFDTLNNNYSYSIIYSNDISLELIDQVISSIILSINDDNIEIVYKQGKPKTPIQRLLDKLVACLFKLYECIDKIDICGENRNSYSKTDQGATMMHMKEDYYAGTNLFKPGYNVQLGISDEYIMDVLVCQDRNDQGTLEPFLENYKSAYGDIPEKIVADAGYGSYDNYMYLTLNKRDLYIKFSSYSIEKSAKYKRKKYRKNNWARDDKGNYICPAGHTTKFLYDSKNTKGRYYRVNQTLGTGKCSECPLKSECTKAIGDRLITHNPILEEFENKVRENLSGEEGQKLKDNRSSQSEGAFGIIKSNNGKIRFRRRGMNLVTLEMTLVCIGFNLMKYHNKKNRH